MKQARNRTESMAQRLAKQPISEGFQLWDTGFPLGAMRLFIFKAESAPPFQLAPCLDAVAHLLQEMNEIPDAAENFKFAEDKYDLINQPVLAKLMRVRRTECLDGPKAGLEEIEKILKEVDPARNKHESGDQALKTGLARLYVAHADLLLKQDTPDADGAIAEAKHASVVGWDRKHVALMLEAKALATKGDSAATIAALEATIAHHPNFLEPRIALVDTLKADGAPPAAVLEAVNGCIGVHPRSVFYREKAFILSENDDDAKALALLDEVIAAPPVEEAGGISSKSDTLGVLYKAKAAILADLGRMQEALAAQGAAIANTPDDPELKDMGEAITKAMAGEGETA